MKTRNRSLKYLFLLVFIFAISCSMQERNPDKKAIIFCASGLSQFINEVKASVENKNFNLSLNISSSGILARQIELGSQADIYISANREWANYIDSVGMADSIISFCKTNLVLVVPKSHKKSNLPELLRASKKIAMGNPSYVPAGKYAKESLIRLGIFGEINEKIVFTNDVKTALKLVELNECQAGFVYYSDAINSSKIDIAEIISDSLHSPVIFYLVRLKTSNSFADSVFNYLLSGQANEFLKKNGLVSLSGK